MARPKKIGLDYFPFDVDIFEDDKFFDLQNEYGPLGEVIYLRLLCMVYHAGYYYRFDSLEKLASMLIRSIGNRWARDKRTVIDVILFLAKINLFSAELMQENVLTSRGIQERYLAATERRQTEITEYSLLEKNAPHEGVLNAPENTVSVTKTDVIATETAVNVCENATKQSKVNKKKVNESNAGSSAPPAAFNTKEELVEKYGSTAVSEYEARFRKWQAKQGTVLVDMYEAISKWMENDGVSLKSKSNSSIDADEVIKDIMSKYHTDG